MKEHPCTNVQPPTIIYDVHPLIFVPEVKGNAHTNVLSGETAICTLPEEAMMATPILQFIIINLVFNFVFNFFLTLFRGCCKPPQPQYGTVARCTEGNN